MSSVEKLIIECWEKSHNRHPLEAALIILNTVIPSKSKKDFAWMNIGNRNLFLFHIREKFFGKKINMLTSCPNCNAELESIFTFDATLLNEKTNNTELFEFSPEDYQITYRLPNSYDLASASKCNEVLSARGDILKNCIIKLSKEDKIIPLSFLPEEIISKLSKEMSNKNPYAETLLDLNCRGCNHKWTIVFDIAAFILSEINFYAQNILRNVHALASAYHWNESEIINMSTYKRNWYINLIGT
jgi:hypothetical protein